MITANSTQRQPMWYDDFDLDLYRLIPDAERIVAPIAGVELRTVGQPDRKTGRLNHPSLWNGDHGMVAFFGFRDGPMTQWKSSFYAAPSASEIACTFEEAIRDTWIHNCLMFVDGQLVWNSWKLCGDLETLMFHSRKWQRRPVEAEAARRRTLREIARAVDRFKSWLQ